MVILAIRGTSLNHTVKVDLSDRVLGSIERTIAVVLILIGYGLIAPLVFLPRLAVMIYQGQADVNRTTVVTKVVVSLVSAIAIAVLLRYIPMPSIF